MYNILYSSQDAQLTFSLFYSPQQVFFFCCCFLQNCAWRPSTALISIFRSYLVPNCWILVYFRLQIYILNNVSIYCAKWLSRASVSVVVKCWCLVVKAVKPERNNFIIWFEIRAVFLWVCFCLHCSKKSWCSFKVFHLVLCGSTHITLYIPSIRYRGKVPCRTIHITANLQQVWAKMELQYVLTW